MTCVHLEVDCQFQANSGLLCLVVRSRLRSRFVPDQKPDSTEGSPSLWAWCTLNLIYVKHPAAGVVRKFGEEGGCQLGNRPRYLTEIQNYDVRAEIALELLQKQDVNITKLKSQNAGRIKVVKLRNDSFEAYREK
ncbi:hypothetical protein AVEN_272379-1 [Araneus ventricosus]|uniref:Uncharacterized protein n=1 Tax=Araneus ventricosus TaxID=182803 RepID=A0A4Y2I0A7_ARAVE|nr:hypothetical protein AVEN_272379-1 [Araneus ventricosus]